MVVIKIIILTLIFIVSVFIGRLVANKYKFRVQELKEILNILNIIETKIKYTYEPLPEIFEDVKNSFKSNVGEIFNIAKLKMKEMSAGEAWKFSLDISNTNMNQEDINVLKNFEKMLGKTDIEGQLSELELLKRHIDVQIQGAEEEKNKNEKLYRSLGITVGLAIVIILI